MTRSKDESIMETSALHTVKRPHDKLRSLATSLNRLHRPPPSPPPSTNPLAIACVSDTHGTQPAIPSGDLLLHAGDLSTWGMFIEIQAQLTWLSEQPHKYKVIIAGNHDLLLDRAFKERHPKRWKQALVAGSHDAEAEQSKSADGLDWGDIIYLENSRITLDFDGRRKLKIYGSPLTPQYGISAFQYPSPENPWTDRIPPDTDILLTHGPPRGHLDGPKKAGCTFLAQEVMRIRPRLVVCGHIHMGRGKQEDVYDEVGRALEDIKQTRDGWGTLCRMACGVLWGRIVPLSLRKMEKRTVFVNAAVVEGWEDHVVKHEAVVVRL